MAGRTPKPRALRVLHGNPGKRPLPKKINTPTSKTVPPAPRSLSNDAKKEWKRIAKLLHGAGLLTKIDMSALEAYCTVYARWKDAERNIDKFGMVVKNAKGWPVLSPYLKIANVCIDQMRHSLAEFGMTPSARCRVKAEPAKEKSSMRDKLNLHKKSK